jgi:phage N-6-adenine-methyltransferase
MAKRLQRTKQDEGPKPSDFWRTPTDCFHALSAEFLFGLDLAADAENHLCPQWLGPGSPLAVDAFALDWYEALSTTGSDAAYVNPPYSKCEQWLARCAEQIQQMTACVIVALVPYTPDTRWWRHTQSAVEIREIPHRVKYLKADGQTKAGAMFPSAVVIYRPQPGVRRGSPRRVTWTWRQPKPNPLAATLRQHATTHAWLSDPLTEAATQLERLEKGA